MCWVSHTACAKLTVMSIVPLTALYQHSSPKIQVRQAISLTHCINYISQLHLACVFKIATAQLSTVWVIMQERACQLTASLAVHNAAHAMDSLPGLLGLCDASVAAPVREQACSALCQIARSSTGCQACCSLQATGATLTLLQLVKGKCFQSAAFCKR